VTRKVLDSASYADLVTAANCIREGGVVVAQTDTNYGVFCSPFSSEACDRLYELKGRDRSKPLSLFISHWRDWDRWGVSPRPERVQNIAEKFWPGPLNLIVGKGAMIPDWVTSGGQSLAIVNNRSTTVNLLITLSGVPLVATSANLSGTMDEGLVTFEIATEHLGENVDIVLRGTSASDFTMSSTIVSLLTDEVRLIRQGDLDMADVLAAAAGT
jgi:L-threonylcarbamoyladenylate synthase